MSVNRLGRALLLAALAALVLAPRWYILQDIPQRDSGVFLYGARRLLAGAVPYRDFWDHKPPLIFFIDALGLSLAGGATWGVWLLEWLSLFAAALIGFGLLHRAFGRLPAWFGTLLWLGGAILILGSGNLTEEFALPFKFAALYLFYRAAAGRPSRAGDLAIGVTFALTFLLKQNLVAVWVAIALYLLLFERAERAWLRRGAVMAVGAALVLAPVALYFVLNDAWRPFVDAAFAYNFAYVSVNIGAERRWLSLSGAVEALAGGGLVFVGLLGWTIAVIWRPAPGGRAGDVAGRRALLGLSALALPLEGLLVTLSGKPHPHYYLAWLPVLAVLAALVAYVVVAAVARRWGPAARARVSAGLLLLLAILLLTPVTRLAHDTAVWRDTRSAHNDLVTFIRAETAPDDYVLLWGAETGLQFAANRAAPSRFVYQYPLYRLGYQRPALTFELLRDLQTRPPALIVDASSSTYAPPLDPAAYAGWPVEQGNYALPPEAERVLAYIRARYERIDAPGAWPVYRRRR